MPMITSSKNINLSEDIFSKVITAVRFPMIVAVVMIHAVITEVSIDGEMLANNHILANFIVNLFSREICSAAVPLFFFISGYLLFYHKEKCDKTTYLTIIKKRAKSLLLPYVLWNLIICGVKYLSQLFFPSMLSGKNNAIADYGITNYLMMFWDDLGGSPMCFQMWFIRDLMCFVIISPIIYWCIKKIGLLTIVLLSLTWVFDLWPIQEGLSSTSLLFCSMGMYFCISRLNPCKILKNNVLQMVMGG